MTTPGPTVHPSNTTIKFSDVNAVFGLGQPSPMDLNYRFPTSLYTPTTPTIPTTPKATFPMEVLHGRTKFSFVTTFTTPGTWTSTVTGNIKVLVVGGGGGGGNGPFPGGSGGGGGGGVIYNTSFPVVLGTVYPYTVGAAVSVAVHGNPSAFSTITAGGGGAGGTATSPATIPTRPGNAPGG